MNSQLPSLRPSANVTPVSAASFFRDFVPCAPRSAALFRPAVPLQAGVPTALAPATAPKMP